MQDSIPQKYCTGCGKLKRLSDFYPKPNSRTTTWCAECFSKRKREEYHEKHPGARSWGDTSPRKKSSRPTTFNVNHPSPSMKVIETCTQKGYSQKEIARVLGWTTPKSVTPYKLGESHFSPERIALLESLPSLEIDEGLTEEDKRIIASGQFSAPDLSRQLGISIWALYRYIHKYQITLPKISKKDSLRECVDCGRNRRITNYPSDCNWDKPICIPCTKKKARIAIRQEMGQRQRPVQYNTRAYRLRRTYNIDSEEYDRMFIEQFGMCAICGKSPGEGRNLNVDHCHQSNIIRGLLCIQCNCLLGMAEDSIPLLKEAIKYLDKHAS